LTNCATGDTNGAVATLTEKLRAKAREQLNAMQDRVAAFERQGGVEAAVERVAERLRREEERLSSGKHSLNPEYQQQIALWYARLELPIGADADAIRTQFRVLMRRYHPDRNVGDNRSEELATRISQDLTVAYEGLLAHLNR
jgi:DnaJ-domain-containing protein 1